MKAYLASPLAPTHIEADNLVIGMVCLIPRTSDKIQFFRATGSGSDSGEMGKGKGKRGRGKRGGADTTNRMKLS
jgi:hypothetical protein